MKLNIQTFNSFDDEWFDEGQQHALISGVERGLHDVVQGIETVGARLNQLRNEWHSDEAARVGNPAADSFNKLSPAAVEYVNSIGNWMASHGSAINVRQGHEVRFTKLDGSANGRVGEFYDVASKRGLENSEVASNTANALNEGVELIGSGLKSVMSAVTSNPDAMPKGVVPDSLEPTVRAENAKVESKYQETRELINKVLKQLHQDIGTLSSSAASDANGSLMD